MIHGFKGKKTITTEEWLIDYSLRSNKHIDVNHDLLSLPIKFDSKEIDAFILDVCNNKLVIQLALPLKEKFDDKSNKYETSYVRKLINSNKFLNRFNPEFVKHVQITEVHTEDYVTNDKLWLLSHEEVDSNVSFLRPNNNGITFEMFKTTDLDAYSQMLLKLLKHKTDICGWRLRSTYSIAYSEDYNRIVGGVNYYGYVGYDYAYSYDYGVLLPACTIC